MRIGIGSDHRGYEAKEFLKRHLENQGYSVKDFGINSNASSDYPDVAFPLAEEVAEKKLKRGILICGSGIGMCISANKVKGAYAALCTNESMASMSRKHNNSNILTLGALYASKNIMKKIVDIWLKEEFEEGRHRRRFNRIRKKE